MLWIERAFTANVPTSEKLILVYLAIGANRAGVGLWNRPELQRFTGYERRSVQRLLKALRDAKLLEDHGDWYVLTHAEAVPAPIDTLPASGSLSTASPAGGPENRSGQLSQEDLEQAGEALAQRLLDASDYLVDQLNNFEARLAQTLTRTIIALPTELAAPPPPLPDPVKEHPLYTQLITLLPEQEARQAVLARMEREREGEASTASLCGPAELSRETRDAVNDFETPGGRFLRVWGVLHDKPPDPDKTADLLHQWLSLEAEENKHTVRGETAAFELLYPAIVEAAKERRGKMTMREFLDLKAIAEGRAPWDLDPAPTLIEDATLEAQVRQMLGELNQANDPRCQVHPRTVERGEDGKTYTESIVGYHRRVLGKYREMQKLKQMGVI